MSEQSILVTGGRGLVGRNLVSTLRKNGLRVYSVDLGDVSDGHGDEIQGEYAARDILDVILPKVSGVVHLAGISGVGDGEASPSKCIEVNALNLTQLCEAVSEHGKFLIFSSSVEVLNYQQGKVSTPNIYGLSKFFGEKIIEYFSSKKQMMASIHRFSTVYETSLEGRKVLPIFLRKAISGEDIVVHNTAEYFDFIHVSDIVAALVKNIDMMCAAPTTDLNRFNLTTGNMLNLYELAEMIIQITRSSSHLGLPADLVKNQGPVQAYSNDEARKILSWKPEIELQDAIRSLNK